MPITDIPLFSTLKTQMRWLQERQRVLAENIANADTPSFQPKDLAPLDAKNLYYLGMSQLKANEKSQGREILDQALAAGLQEPLAADARRAISEFDNRK